MQKCIFAAILLFVIICIWQVLKTGNFGDEETIWTTDGQRRTGPCRGQQLIQGSSGPVKNHSRIFFLETSGRGEISLRFLTGVESAAFWNPDKEVVVFLFSGPIGSFPSPSPSPPTPAMVGLGRKYPNIRYESTTIERFVLNTPLEKWHRSGKLKQSKWPAAETSDGLRLLELWRSGGIYMDFDILTIQKLYFPNDVVVWEKRELYLSNAFLVFQKFHSLMFMAMNQFAEHFSTKDYGDNGPALLDGQYKKYKEYKGVLGENTEVDVLPAKVVFPYINHDWKNYFEKDKKNTVLKTINGSVAIHWWNFLSKVEKVEADSDCAFMDLVKKYCPFVYSEIQKQGWV